MVLSGLDLKKVALYVRVSSDEQKREGLSIDAQISKLKKYCEYKKWEVYKIYQDEGKSGKSIKGRLQFQNMLSESKEDKFSAILITKFDRAFRNVKESLVTFDELKKRGIDFISISEEIDTTTPMGKFFFVIISAFSELERNMTSGRNKDIMRYKFNKGLFPSKTPFGYLPIKKDKKIVGYKIHPKRGKIVSECFKMASEGISYKDICFKFKLKPQCYYNILRNKSYFGILSFEGIERKGNHIPIIKEELFNKVQPLIGGHNGN